jgi:hypothetical protein
MVKSLVDGGYLMEFGGVTEGEYLELLSIEEEDSFGAWDGGSCAVTGTATDIRSPSMEIFGDTRTDKRMHGKCENIVHSISEKLFRSDLFRMNAVLWRVFPTPLCILHPELV